MAGRTSGTIEHICDNSHQIESVIPCFARRFPRNARYAVTPVGWRFKHGRIKQLNIKFLYLAFLGNLPVKYSNV
jgi:hypothetical protein